MDIGWLLGIVIALIVLWILFLVLFWALRPKRVSVREIVTLIPEFIPVLGPLDDVVVAVVAMRYVRPRVGVEDLRARWKGTDAGFSLLLRVIGST